MSGVRNVLTVAGSDPSGGAGIQADLRAFRAVGVHGASVITVVTAQGTRGIRKVAPLHAEMVRAQLDAVFEDMAPQACKTGALGDADTVEIVADALRARPTLPLVVDPVINPTRGRALLDDSGFASLVLDRSIRTPAQTEQENPSLVGGDLAGGSYELDQQLLFRPDPCLCRYGTPLRGLYMAGASTHPGGAVHGMSGRGAARALLRDRKLRRA